MAAGLPIAPFTEMTHGLEPSGTWAMPLTFGYLTDCSGFVESVLETWADVRRILRARMSALAWTPTPVPTLRPALRFVHRAVDVAHWLPNMPRGSEET